MQQQEIWAKELDIELDEAERAYQFMRWCDRLSLILAQRMVPAMGRALEITSGIDAQRYDIRELEDGKLTVEPWPFRLQEFTVNVESVRLSELKYESNEALTEALQTSPIKQLE